jgi:hypothetical protein
LTYDSARHQVVLVGGQANAGLTRDTWAWDGSLWTQLEDIGPSARTGHALAFDSSRKRVVLFGGSAGTNVLNDTWEWDGASWTQVADTGPPARQGVACAFSTKLARVVLFGGMDQNNQAFADTWTWDGTDWTEEQDVGPSARANHRLAYDAVRDRVVLFGGMTVQSYQVDEGNWLQHNWVTKYNYFYVTDTWEWDGTKWTRVADTGPSARASHGMLFDGSRVVLFGGQGGGYFADTWAWDGKFWTELQDVGPGPRAPAGMAYDSDRGRAVLFGGAAPANSLGDTWEFYDHSGS